MPISLMTTEWYTHWYICPVIEDPCCLPYKNLELKPREIPAESPLLTSYRVSNKDSMSHTTQMTILNEYYNQNQPPLKTSDKTAKVPHMAARGAV